MLVRSPSRGKQGIFLVDISLGVLFENSIVCYVFYAIWFWGAARLCGFLGLFVFGLPGSGFCLGLGWAMWSGFLGFVLAFPWLFGWGFVGFVWRV